MGIRLILSQFYGYSKKRTIVREEVYGEETTSFSREFKLEAIRFLSKGKKTELKHHQRVGNKTKDEMIHMLKRRLPENQTAENAHLKQELAKVLEENDILKKTATFFARKRK